MNSSSVEITITKIDTSVTLDNSTITANTSDATYQWLDCNNDMSPISGATNSSYTATTNGSYAVEITQNGCTEISSCTTISTLGIAQNSNKINFKVYPNPTSGDLTIYSEQIQKNLNVSLYSLMGQQLLNKNYQNTSLVKLHLEQPTGLYLLKVSTANGKQSIMKITIK